MKAVFVSFPASDYAASKEFYETVVGLPVAREHDGPPHRFTNYDLGGLILKVYEWTEEYFGSGHSGLFIETDELDRTIERIHAAGGRATDIEVHEWGGRSSSVTDPFGNIFDLIDSRRKGNA